MSIPSLLFDTYK
jgi:hypothetical protein